MPLRLAWKTDPGLHREENEDSVLVWEDRAGVDAMLVVCDGMGGHAAGREASTIAVDTFSKTLEDDGAATPARERLVRAFEQANTAVFETAKRVPEWAGMGSTLTAVLISGDRLALLNVGDSPGYVVRSGEVFPIFQDHSWPAEQLRAGLIDASQVKDHPYKHRLTRAVGVWEAVAPFTAEIELEDGDLVLLASDGVETAGVELEELSQILASGDLQAAVDRIVERCIELGGPDNITVALAHYSAAPVETKTVAMPALDRASARSRGRSAGRKRKG